MLKSKLAEKGINVSDGGPQATPLYMERNQLEMVLRASVHYYNTPEEVEEFVKATEVIICQK